jgi:cation diffusion facilitator CzcD-associated flavoprotein CzcO
MNKFVSSIRPALPPHADAAETACWMTHLPYADEAAFAEGAAQLPKTLDELAAHARREMNITGYPLKHWCLPRMGPDGATALDVLVVGGGQAGLGVAHALKRAHIDNILVVEAAPEGREGPWSSYARMPTLRTHKDNGGLEAGIPSLSFRAWYETQHGYGSWRRLYKVPTAAWHAYLCWFRKVAEIPLRYATRFEGFDQDASGLIAARLTEPTGSRTIFARTVVLATGMEGNGTRNLPGLIGPDIPRSLYAHTQEDIDFAALKEKQVLVLGGGASAYDNAIVAAEAGAQVHVFHRDKELPPVNPGTWGEFNGYLTHYADLSPEQKWRFARTSRLIKSGPPVATQKRARELDNLVLHPGDSWTRVAHTEGTLTVTAISGSYAADFLILGTGYRTDLAAVPALKDHLGEIALWRDMYTPPADLPGNGLECAPWLNGDFNFCPRPGNARTWHDQVFNFSRGAQLSMGTLTIGISGIRFGMERLVYSVGKYFFRQDSEQYLKGLQNWQARDLAALDT